MRRYFNMTAVIAALLMTASCQKEGFAVAEGDYAEISFTTDLPGAATKAIADGLTVNKLYYEIYTADALGEPTGDPVYDTTTDIQAGQATVNVRLIKNKTYVVFFWAQYEGEGYASPYTVTDLKNISVSYDNAPANDEKRDAFYAVKTVKYSSASAETVELKRPFAQVNVGTSDLAEVLRQGERPQTTSLIVTGVSNKFNLFEGVAEAPAEEINASFTTAYIPGLNDSNKDTYTVADVDGLTAGGNSYDYLSMAYILVPGRKDDTSVSTLTAIVTYPSGVTATISYEGATLQQNRRTNLIGQLLTTSADYKVIVDENFDKPDYDYVYENVQTVEDANSAFEKGSTSVKIAEIEQDATLILPPTTEASTVLLPATDKTITFIYAAKNDETKHPEILNITVPAESEANIELDVPSTTVYINGTLKQMKAATADNTLIVGAGTTIKELIIVKGNVRIETGAYVKKITREGDINVKVWLAEGATKPEEVGEGITIIETEKYTFVKTSNTSYQVYNATGLEMFRDAVNGGNTFSGCTIELADDIDLKNESWSRIGSDMAPFKGVFNGNNRSIKNLKILETEAIEGKAYIGLFGYTKNTTIKNLTIENVDINIACLDIDHSQGHIGAVAGSLEGTSTIENVTVKGDIKVEATFDANGASRVAVVAGGNIDGNVTMRNVHVQANEGSYLKSNNNVGALAGQLQVKNVFENCSSNIDVTAKKFFAGGLIGIAAGNSTFTNCHTTGDVTVTAGREGNANDHYRVGGIAGGWADNTSTPCVLINCSYTGEVSGTNADGSVAETLDYEGYVGRGYTLSNRAGSKVTIDNVSYIQEGNTADYFGKYIVVRDEVY